jgi:octaprenyl-diphosphate synthase
MSFIMDLNAIHENVRPKLEKVNCVIQTALNSPVHLVEEIGHYITHSGGKRLRPILAILAAESFSYQGTDHLKLAAIIELIHTSTLLHDDVVDDSALRRGRRTSNAVFGNSASVLVGDFLYSRSFQLMVELESLTIIKILSQCTKTLAEGEVLQLTSAYDPEISETIYRQTVYCKTASLFEATTYLSALIAQSSVEHSEQMKIYGKHLGMAFQMIDDLLDYTATDDNFGKQLGNDLAEGKMTMPMIYALRTTTDKDRQKLIRILTAKSSENLSCVIAILKETHALEYTQKQAELEAELAIAALSNIPDSPAKQALITLAKVSTQRSS